MTCTHTFIRINDASRPRHLASGTSSTAPSVPVSWNGMLDGAIAGCINCGQIRKVFSDGTLEITHPGGNPIVDHANQ